MIMNKTEKNYLASIKLLGEQVKQSFTEASLVKLPRAYRTIDKIMAGGMGGSQLGVDLIKALFNKQLKLPIAQVRNYQLPGFVHKKGPKGAFYAGIFSILRQSVITGS